MFLRIGPTEFDPLFINLRLDFVSIIYVLMFGRTMFWALALSTGKIGALFLSFDLMSVY